MRAGLLTRKRLVMMLTALTLLFALIGVRIGSLTIIRAEQLQATLTEAADIARRNRQQKPLASQPS